MVVPTVPAVGRDERAAQAGTRVVAVVLALAAPVAVEDHGEGQYRVVRCAVGGVSGVGS